MAKQNELIESMTRFQQPFEQHLNIRDNENGSTQVLLTGGVTEFHANEQHWVTEVSVAAVVINRQ